MTISISLKDATGALFLNEGGQTNDATVPTLQGFLNFIDTSEGCLGSLRLEVGAWLTEIEAGERRYRLLLGRSREGHMLSTSKKRRDSDPDYEGSIGAEQELLVKGWNHVADGRQYILLNIRVNHAFLRRQHASFI